MELFIESNEIEEITLDNLIQESNDRGIVKVPLHPREINPENRDNLTKEIIAYDTMIVGAKTAAEIHGVDQSNCARYSKGIDIADEETRANILSVKHGIQDKAITKLMDTLNLFDPNCLDKMNDVVKAAGTLAGIVEKISPNGRNGNSSVTLNLYAPRQNKVEKYEVIDI